MKHVPIREIGYALAFLVLLAAVYVGGYYALVIREDDWQIEFGELPRVVIMPPQAVYRLGGDSSKDFFSLLHEIDRRLRPSYWSP